MLYRHHQSEEIYHITSGSGLMTVGSKQFEVYTGDTVCINPNAEHKVLNNGSEILKFIAVSSPAYQHTDTELVRESSHPS